MAALSAALTLASSSRSVRLSISSSSERSGKHEFARVRGTRGFGLVALSERRDLRAAATVSNPVVVFAAGVGWVLKPIGDGDCNHLEESVPMPGPIEINADALVVGRTSERADVAIPVPTVSGRHARLEKKGQSLYVTDLGSTNGTYLNNKKLRKGDANAVEPGSSLIFGDEHLAQYQLVEVVEA